MGTVHKVVFPKFSIEMRALSGPMDSLTEGILLFSLNLYTFFQQLREYFSLRNHFCTLWTRNILQDCVERNDRVQIFYTRSFLFWAKPEILQVQNACIWFPRRRNFTWIVDKLYQNSGAITKPSSPWVLKKYIHLSSFGILN